MEVINLVLALPLVGIGAFFLYIGWRRGIRFMYHDYQGNTKERLRDNILSSFTVSTSFCCFILIWAPKNLQGFTVPVILFLILAVTPISILGAYWSSFLTKIMSGNSDPFGLRRIDDGQNIKWYELTPIAFAASWIVYYLIYIALLLVNGFEVTSENAPHWIIIIALLFAGLVAYVVTIEIYKKFKNE